MRTTWGSSRRVGVWAARKRAAPARMSADRLGALRPGQRLTGGRLVHLEPVELGVLAKQRRAQGRQHRGTRDPPAASHPYTMAPASSTMSCWSQHPGSAPRSGGADGQRMTAGQRGGRHVEEAVEEHLAGALVDAPGQLRRGRPLQQLMHGVGGGEGVVDDIPVAVVVLGVEAGHPQGGGVGHRPGQLLQRGAGGHGPVEGGHDLGRVVAEDHPGQAVDVVVAREGARPGCAPSRRAGRSAAARASRPARSWGWRQAAVSSARDAPAVCWARVGRT